MKLSMIAGMSLLGACNAGTSILGFGVAGINQGTGVESTNFLSIDFVTGAAKVLASNVSVDASAAFCNIAFSSSMAYVPSGARNLLTVDLATGSTTKNVTFIVDGQASELAIPSLGFDPPSGLLVSIVMVQQQWKLASIDPTSGVVAFLTAALPIHFPEGINLCEAAYSPSLASASQSATSPSGIMYFAVSAQGNDESIVAFDLSLGKIVANETFVGGVNVMTVDWSGSDRAVYVISMFRPIDNKQIGTLPNGLRLLRLDPSGAGSIELIGLFADRVVPAYQGVGMFDAASQTIRVALGIQEGSGLASSLFSVPVSHPQPSGGLPDGWNNISLAQADALVPRGLWKLA